jgi:hypothetical protein
MIPEALKTSKIHMKTPSNIGTYLHPGLLAQKLTQDLAKKYGHVALALANVVLAALIHAHLGVLLAKIVHKADYFHLVW